MHLLTTILLTLDFASTAVLAGCSRARYCTCRKVGGENDVDITKKTCPVMGGPYEESGQHVRIFPTMAGVTFM
ncbi:hypothetical protein Tdes44962_MAKER09260 [Teratosphaeria destructans]|uniref:Secreted protein n=1 Tax=Teratosphaeria destructans TaxID=418781 RepID=A0A9W7W345_9PEZI|nr:hypothetical protein Tdes44962_MAKER09260 [Teratosphaeria destructans]